MGATRAGTLPHIPTLGKNTKRMYECLGGRQAVVGVPGRRGRHCRGAWEEKQAFVEVPGRRNRQLSKCLGEETGSCQGAWEEAGICRRISLRQQCRADRLGDCRPDPIAVDGCSPPIFDAGRRHGYNIVSGFPAISTDLLCYRDPPNPIYPSCGQAVDEPAVAVPGLSG